MNSKNLLCLILVFFIMPIVVCQEEDIPVIHKERINQIIHVVNAVEMPNINNYLDLFFVNSELEKSLYINKKIGEGINEEKADSIFDWVVMQNREKNESLVLNKLKNYLSPIRNFSVNRICEANDSYTIYEVIVTVGSKGSKENKKNKFYFQIGKITEEKYPIINIYDSKWISIITGKPKGC